MDPAALPPETGRVVDAEAAAVRRLARQLTWYRAPTGTLTAHHGDVRLLRRCRIALTRCAAAGAEPAILVASLADGGAVWSEANGASPDDGPPQPPPRCSMTLGAAAAAYLDHLTRTQYSVATRTVRAVHLRLFCAWAATQGLADADSVTQTVLERYQDHLLRQRTRLGTPLALASQHTRLAHLRAWWAWLTRTYGLVRNPAADLALPRVGVRLPPVLSAAEAERVLAQPDVATLGGLRDRAMLELFYATGMRRTELLQLTLAVLDRPRGLVTIRQGKGRRDRVVPVGPRTLGWLDRYLTGVRPRWVRAPDPGTLFLTAHGAPLHPNHLSALVRAYVQAAQVGTRGACHLFRHTMATLMLEGGADIRFIQQMLGHAKLTTTQLYTHVSIRQLQAVHAATHPAGRGVPPGAPFPGTA